MFERGKEKGGEKGWKGEHDRESARDRGMRERERESGGGRESVWERVRANGEVGG